MNGLCSLLKPDNVLLGISPSSKKRIFEQASQTLSLIYGLDRKEIFDGLFARERLGSTYLDHGSRFLTAVSRTLKNRAACL